MNNNIFNTRKNLKNDEEELYQVDIEKYNKVLEQEKKLNKIRRIFLTIFLIPWLSFLIPSTFAVLKDGNKYNLVLLLPFWLIALVIILVAFVKK